MPTVVYRLKDGSERRVDVPAGESVMQGAIQNDLRGIDADCGGCCSCATCHVYVAEEFLAKLPPPDAMENDLLSGVAAEQKPNSRLSCQITVTEMLDGIVVHMPERQS